MSFLNRIKQHLLPVILLGVPALVLLGWWMVWSFAAAQYRHVLDGWIERGRASGYNIAYDKREQFGFPYKVVSRFEHLRWTNTDGITFTAGDIDIGAMGLWETQRFTAKFKGQVEISAPLPNGKALIIGGERGNAKVTLASNGSWQECTLDMETARLGRAPDYVFTMDALSLVAKRPAMPPATTHEAGLEVQSKAQHVTLPAAMPPSFGPTLSKLELDLRVMGAVPDFRKQESAAAWSAANGLVTFDTIRMEWGSLLMQASGTLGFDDDQQPEGVFNSTIGHADDVLRILAETGMIPPNQQEMIGPALKAYALPAMIENEDGLQMPINVQLGGLFLGPLRVFSYPAIPWQ